MTITKPGGTDFTYMLMPIKIKSVEPAASGSEE